MLWLTKSKTDQKVTASASWPNNTVRGKLSKWDVFFIGHSIETATSCLLANFAGATFSLAVAGARIIGFSIETATSCLLANFESATFSLAVAC